MFLATATALGGCATAERQVSDASRVADAGIGFADTLPPLYDAFTVLSIEADSLELKAQRELLSDIDALEQKLDESNDDLRATTEIVRDLKRHAGLLKSYFLALRDLAGEEVGAEIPGAARTAVADLEKVGVGLSSRTIGGTSVGALTEPLAAYAVRAAQSAALRAEIEARGTTINREIARHEQAIEVLALRMRGDRERILIETVENPLRDEFLDLGRRLPDDWWRRRADYLRLTIEIDAVNRAQSAARNLRIAWEDLAAGRGQTATLDAINQDIVAVNEFLARLSGARE